ncbi:MAG: acyltransferase [Lachnospiraceae bacterium]|nr:acyltransferase [Lachnospiraceae bacterium]MBO6209042.1 acyltransferase [Lachnospiraceae bacterium]
MTQEPKEQNTAKTQPTASGPGRYEFMSVLRLLSLMGVVYYHTLVTLYLQGIRQKDTIEAMYANVNMNFPAIGVGLFLMLSGGGLMMSSKKKADFSVKNFYKGRFMRILIPFYISYILYSIYLFLIGFEFPVYFESLTGVKPSPLCFIFTLLGMDGYLSIFNIPTFTLMLGEWFLGCLIPMYIVFPLLRKCIMKNRNLTLIIATIYYIIALATYKYMPWAEVPSYNNFTIKIYDFILGMFLVEVMDRIPKWTAAIGVALLGFYLLYPAKLPIDMTPSIVILSVGTFFIFLALEGLFKKMPHFMKVVNVLSAYSYTYFLFHHIVIGQACIYANKHGDLSSNKNLLLLFLAQILITSAVAVLVKVLSDLVYKAMKKAPKKVS